jgi:predicted ATPase
MYIERVTLLGDAYPTEDYYPFNLHILRHTRSVSLTRPVTFFVGENGSGKSTLLEAITRKCGIHVWDKPSRRAGSDNPYETRLADFIRLTWAENRVPGSLFRAETFKELADFLDDVSRCDPGRLKYQGGKVLSTLSHGEGMLAYLDGRFRRKGLYFLDEPEAALSPSSQLRFLKLLQDIADEGVAQFVIATHSPILLAMPGAQILSFNGSRIQDVRYEETQHYKLYKQFFTDRARLLGHKDGEPVGDAPVKPSSVDWQSGAVQVAETACLAD